MKKLKLGNSSLFMSLVEVLIGVLLLIDPLGFTEGIITVFGIVIALMGLVQVIGYFRTEAAEAAVGGKLSKGLLMIAAGCFCGFKAQWFLATFPVITVVYGAMILVAGVNKLQSSVDMLRMKMKYWFIALIGAILTLAFAVLILVNPFNTTTILWNFIGITLIVEAVIDIATYFAAKKK